MQCRVVHPGPEGGDRRSFCVPGCLGREATSSTQRSRLGLSQSGGFPPEGNWHHAHTPEMVAFCWAQTRSLPRSQTRCPTYLDNATVVAVHTRFQSPLCGLVGVKTTDIPPHAPLDPTPGCARPRKKDKGGHVQHRNFTPPTTNVPAQEAAAGNLRPHLVGNPSTTATIKAQDALGPQ